MFDLLFVLILLIGKLINKFFIMNTIYDFGSATRDVNPGPDFQSRDFGTVQYQSRDPGTGPGITKIQFYVGETNSFFSITCSVIVWEDCNTDIDRSMRKLNND